MNRRTSRAALAAAAVLLLAVPASAQQGQNVRGTLTAFDGKVATVKTKAGDTVEINVPDTARISTTKPFTVGDIKQGMTLGVTTVKQPDGSLVAIDVRPIPATAKPGLSPYDLAPQSTMTNATLEAMVAATGGQELTLNHGSGTVKVLMTDKTAMSRAEPGGKADLKPGETIYVFAERGEGGKWTAVRMQVSKDGVKPTQ
jgi:hypothetical protein